MLEQVDLGQKLAKSDYKNRMDILGNQLGELRFVLDVALVEGRKLARADAAVVRNNLAAQGFHLQFPPTMADPMTDDWGTDA